MDVYKLESFIWYKVIRIFCFLFFIYPGLVSAKDFPDTFSIAPEPGWVKLQSLIFADVIEAENISGGVNYLLADEQVSVLSGYSRYSRYVSKITNSEGVQSNSTINLEYNPEFQKIIIHRINIIRDDENINKLHEASVNILRREKQMDRQIYDGRLTVNVILDDVREGDIIDYSYTVKGRNPAKVGVGSGYFDTQWSVPVIKQYRRLLWPKEKPLFIKYFSREITPQVNENGDVIEYVWQEENIAAVSEQDDVPSWHDTYSWIQFSETNDWEKIKERGRVFYTVTKKDSLAVKYIVDEIKRGIKDKKSQLELAIYYVQDKIRYTGIEIGVNSFIPYSPEEVLKRRYGDCKDKTMLFLSILSGLEIEASPVLVNTRSDDELNRYLPSISLFDHMISKVSFDNQDYWIDLTRTHQGRKIEYMYQPDYGYALVIDKTAEGLIDMMTSEKIGSTVQVSETYDLSEGFDKPAKLTIQSIYSSYRAENLRGNLASSNKTELAAEYMDYMSGIFPTIVKNDEFRIEDKPDLNQIIVYESYLIPGLWERSQDGTEYLSVYQYEINGYLKKPKSKNRNYPFKIAHPVHVEQTTNVVMPEEWNVTQSNTEIKSGPVSFKTRLYNDGNRIYKKSEYKTNGSTVEIADINNYIDDINRASDKIEVHLYKEVASTFIEKIEVLYEEIKIEYILLLFLLPGLFISFLIYTYFYKGDMPLLSFWFYPRNTISYVHDNPSPISFFTLISVAGIYYCLEEFFMGELGVKYPQLWIWCAILLLGPLVGLIQVYIWGWLLSITGKWLDSPVGMKELRLAIVWSGIPSLISVFILVSLAFMMKEQFFYAETTIFDNNYHLLSYFIGGCLVLVFLAIWWCVAQVAMLAELQNFVLIKALGHVLLTFFLAMGVLLVPIIIIAIIAGAFS